MYLYSGELLRKIRLLKGLSQTGVAKKLKKTQQAISKMEKKFCLNNDEFELARKAMGCSDKELEIMKNYPPPGKIAD